MKTILDLVAAAVACVGWFFFAQFAIAMTLSAVIYRAEVHPDYPAATLMILLTGVVSIFMMLSRSFSGGARIYNILKRLRDEEKVATR